MERRQATGWATDSTTDAAIPQPIRLWQEEIHIPGIYDLEVDTSILSPEACAARIRQQLLHGSHPSAFEQLAAMVTPDN